MLRFGFIGCGNVARYHADVVRALGHDVRAVAARANSPRMDSFAHEYQINHKFDDWRSMLGQGGLDAVIMATSWDQTGSLAQGVIQSGLPVLIEKPLALTSQKVQEILESTRKFHDQVMIGFNRRFYDFVPRLKEMIATYPLLSVELHCPDSFQRNLKEYGEALREHILIYKTSHWLDLLMYLLGDVRMVAMYRRIGVPPAYNGILEASGNIPVHFHANFDAPSQVSLTLIFESFICQLGPMEVLRIYEGISVAEETREVPYRRYEPKLKEEQSTDSHYKPGFLNQIRHFVDVCVEKRERNNRGCTLPEVLRVTELCEAIQG